MRKIKLNVLGISYSQTQSGAYALVLSEEDGEKRLPIIIGGFEAQSIVIKLENLNPPRPLTHDLFKSFADLLDVKMREVFIHKLEEGVFYSQLVCTKDDKELLIDSRTSDAVALALRFECPVYITEEIMDKAGIIIKGDEAEEMLGGRRTGGMESSEDDSLSSFSLAELTNMLQEAIESEDYERAAAIRDEIGKKEKK
ncbi:MAG: bifunctional nuclease family protein [Bacteroidales bacterium]|nr:bifunctional nuclease family protein [Bacteroidales bacterium]